MKIKVFVTMFVLYLSLSATAFAQNESDMAYQVITPDNVDQLTEQFSFECGADTDRAASAFYENIFAFACFSTSPYPTIYAYSLETGERLWRLAPRAFLREFWLLEEDLVLVDLQSSVYTYRIGEDEPIFNERFSNLARVAVSPDQKYMALIPNDFDEGGIVVYSLPDFQRLEHEFTMTVLQVLPIAVSDAETGLIALGEASGVIRVYNVESGELVLETSPSQQLVEVSGEGSGGVSLYDGHNYNELVFTPSGGAIIATECTYMEMGCWETGITVFNSETGEIDTSFEVEHQGYQIIGFTDDTHFLATEFCNQILDLLDLDSFTRTSIPHDIESQCKQGWASLSKDGKLIALYEYHEQQSHYRIFGIPE